MSSQSYLGEKLIALFLIGMVFFQYPILSLVNYVFTIADMPILFFYLFAGWALFISAVMIVMKPRKTRKKMKHSSSR